MKAKDFATKTQRENRPFRTLGPNDIIRQTDVYSVFDESDEPRDFDKYWPSAFCSLKPGDLWVGKKVQAVMELMPNVILRRPRVTNS